MQYKNKRFSVFMPNGNWEWRNKVSIKVKPPKNRKSGVIYRILQITDWLFYTFNKLFRRCPSNGHLWTTGPRALLGSRCARCGMSKRMWEKTHDISS